MTTAEKLRCITCNKGYETADPIVHTRLAQFDGWCICRDCVDIYGRRKVAEKVEEH